MRKSCMCTNRYKNYILWILEVLAVKGLQYQLQILHFGFFYLQLSEPWVLDLQCCRINRVKNVNAFATISRIHHWGEPFESKVK